MTAAGSDSGLVYALKASVEVLAAPDGRIYLLRPGTSDLVVPEPDAVDRALLEELATPADLEELAGRLEVEPGVVREKLAALDAVDVLTSWPGATVPLEAGPAARFDRQLPYLAEFGPPAEMQRKLLDATVVILGCGGLGTWTLGGLACAGVGSFVLVDDDAVEPSNLNRQVLYVDADVARPKVTCAAEWVTRFAPETRVATHERRVTSTEDVVGLARDADLVVMLADHPPYVLERWVNAACQEVGVPYIACGQATPLMKIGPLYVPGRTACFACEETEMRSTSPLYDEVVAMRQRNDANAMTVGPASGLVGTMLSIEIMHFLLGRPAATEGRALLVDIQTFRTWWEPIARNPDCAVCGSR